MKTRDTSDQIIDALDRRVTRREERRNFFKATGGFAVGAVGGAVLGACSSSADGVIAQNNPGSSDADVLNFALNLEYLEAQFYSFAAFGTGLAAADLTGTGTQGAVTGGAQVAFSDPLVAQYAREIAQDEIAHVRFLRQALGSAAVAQPAIDISGSGPNTAFSNAARAAGLIGPGQTFNPYADDNSFLLGAYIFEDVGVTAYKGASPLINNRTFLEAAAGILAVEAYHAGIVRTVLYSKGVATPSLRTGADNISNARDSLDGASDLDQGISPTATGPGGALVSNLVPTDANGIAFSRTTGQVLNIVYLRNTVGTGGGFFPNGVNGNIRSSAG